jgi:hypothetical protein
MHYTTGVEKTINQTLTFRGPAVLSLASGKLDVSIVRTAPLFLFRTRKLTANHGVLEVGITFYGDQHVLCDFQA